MRRGSAAAVSGLTPTLAPAAQAESALAPGVVRDAGGGRTCARRRRRGTPTASPAERPEPREPPAPSVACRRAAAVNGYRLGPCFTHHSRAWSSRGRARRGRGVRPGRLQLLARRRRRAQRAPRRTTAGSGVRHLDHRGRAAVPSSPSRSIPRGRPLPRRHRRHGADGDRAAGSAAHLARERGPHRRHGGRSPSRATPSPSSTSWRPTPRARWSSRRGRASPSPSPSGRGR